MLGRAYFVVKNKTPKSYFLPLIIYYKDINILAEKQIIFELNLLNVNILNQYLFCRSHSFSVSLVMKLLITGSRNFDDYEGLKIAFEALEKELGESASLILHGGAKGADQLAEQYANERGMKTIVIRPDYEQHPAKVAPLKRNSDLVNLADATLALYGKDRDRKGGTWDAVQKTIKANKPLLERMSDGKIVHTEPQLTLF